MWFTTEPADLVDNSYSEVVKNFIEKNKKPRKGAKKRKIPKEYVDPKQTKRKITISKDTRKFTKNSETIPGDAMKKTNEVFPSIELFSGTFQILILNSNA